MDSTENNFLLKVLRISLIGIPFIFTLLYIPGFMFPGSFPRSIFLYVAISLILVLWLLYCFKQERIVIQKNWLTAAGENISIAGLLDKVRIGVISDPRIKHFQIVKRELYFLITDYAAVNAADIFIQFGSVRKNEIHTALSSHKYW